MIILFSLLPQCFMPLSFSFSFHYPNSALFLGQTHIISHSGGKKKSDTYTILSIYRLRYAYKYETSVVNYFSNPMAS